MAKQRFGKQPKREMDSKHKKYLERQAEEKRRRELAKTSDKQAKKAAKPALPFGLDNRNTLLAAASGLVLTILVICVVLINVYTVQTRKDKIDMQNEYISTFELIDRIDEIYKKYGFTSSNVDEARLDKKITDVDRFNLSAYQYLLDADTHATTMKNEAQVDYSESYEKHPAGETVTVLMNEKNGVTAEVLYEVSENGYTLTVNGVTVESGYVEKPDEYFYVLDYFQNNNRLLVCQDFGAGDYMDYFVNNRKVHLYYYDNENIIYSGYRDSGINRLITSNYAYLQSPGTTSLLIEREYYEVFGLDEEDFSIVQYLDMDVDILYNYTVPCRVMVLQDAEVADGRGETPGVFTIYAGETIDIVSTDEKEFIAFTTPDGYEGYLRVVDGTFFEVGGDKIPATDLLFGLSKLIQE